MIGTQFRAVPDSISQAHSRPNVQPRGDDPTIKAVVLFWQHWAEVMMRVRRRTSATDGIEQHFSAEHFDT
jgi:hypothetical protein